MNAAAYKTSESVSIPTVTVVLPQQPPETTETTATQRRQRRQALTSSQVQIALDETEQAVFATLRDATAAYNAGWMVVSSEEEVQVEVAQGTPVPVPQQQQQQQKEQLVMRVAGGWVRDKLLQLQSHDIDIAVNVLTGHQAALLVKKFLEHQKQRQQQQQQQQTDNNNNNTPQPHSLLFSAVSSPSLLSTPPPPTTTLSRAVTAGRIGVIAANPDQSKHLETATMKIAGVPVDFGNLRGAEVYAAHSRIPTTTMFFGTARDDALRRDFTLNALFYNLNTGQVEDWTGRGLHDLRHGRLVTPLDALQTFRDDPLRVLRAIRFAVRYQLELDPAMQAAAQNTDIHQALHVKISRERVGKELEGMLSGKGANPVVALRTISRLKLAGSVFSLPIVGQDNVASMRGSIAGCPYNDQDHNGVQARSIREHGWEVSHRLLDIFAQVWQAHDANDKNKVSNHHHHPQQEQQQEEAEKETAGTATATTSYYHRRLAAVAAFLLPFRHLIYKVQTKERDFWAVVYAIQQGIKFKNTDARYMTALIETLPDMVGLLERSASAWTADEDNNNNDDNNEAARMVNRLQVGLVLRSTKETWVTSLLLATVLKIDEQNQHSASSSTAVVDWIQVSQKLKQTVLDMNLNGCWKMKPLLNGRTLIETLSLPQGPLIKPYLEEQVKWMLLNPDGSKEACEAHLQSFKRKLDEETTPEEEVVGMSDGSGMTPSSPVGSREKSTVQHFSKKMHVESMEL